VRKGAAAANEDLKKCMQVAGKNFMVTVIEWRFADGKYERLSDLAAELVRMKVDAIVTGGTPGIRAAQRATAVIPIVMTSAADPVSLGFVANLARPGGNLTGVCSLTDEVSVKHLDLLMAAIPELSRLSLLMNRDNPGHSTTLQHLQVAAQKHSLKILPVHAHTPQEIELGIGAMRKAGAQAMIVLIDPFFLDQRQQIGDLAGIRQVDRP